MKSTGIVRKVDELGRVVLPVELRRSMGIAEKDPIEILVDGELIVLRKYVPCCVFCGSSDGTQTFNKKIVCQQCATEIFENTKAM
ncbi:transcriptional regulator, AbrB family [Desulfofarcimen acetoxidans DSM 771]|uniref:Transcriptional regulator, AbrB family n=1 Tax=Desulfofarcimen acetoxidans (strain ATCC 49208 / DSM 771 / KCTC 5769 / VKM B-1644 / 5575) TaxID=485916 RepID=C8W2K8_DESAS|nr:AbrB/MazE/SpoVT family DNA-binding domain-containing protein [Desulfofarcimen acetoxidans]ACV63692.1 transcriptional regulator, AbrB family [Desulfofarcimen acetoxidans DSM 771]